MIDWKEQLGDYIEPEHLDELLKVQRDYIQATIFALGMLADVMDGDMTGAERDEHIYDARSIIMAAIKEHSNEDANNTAEQAALMRRIIDATRRLVATIPNTV